MVKFKKIVFLAFLALFYIKGGYAQLIGTGITEDLSRTTENQKPTQKTSQFKINAISAFSDSLQLPFFEDFTGMVVPIDSIVINTSDNLVRVYDKVLNSLSDGDPIFIGTIIPPPANSILDTLCRIRWFIKKESNGIYYIDSSTSHRKFFGTNTTIKNAYFRPQKANYRNYLADTLKWKDGENTFINNRYPIKPISFNVATFDGLKADGTPYNTVNVSAVGYTDYLTSHPINLKSLSVADSVYLSFYWQHSGIGELPELNDFLELQFKDTLNYWNTIQTINGNGAYTDYFKFNNVLISDKKYFFKGFQFRLRSNGRMSGPYDIWNVDYIYLNKNRTAIDSLRFDITIGNAEESFLKNYSAMPYNQFFYNKNNEIGGLDYTMNSLSLNNILPPYSTFQFDIALTYSEKALGKLHLCNGVSGQQTISNTNVGDTLTFSQSCPYNFSALTDNSLPRLINQEYYIPQGDTINIFHAANNRFITSTVLWDYYAYDDGSPEWGVAANQIGAKIANKFTTNIKDKLTDIEIYFTKSKGPNMDGRSISLCVWNHAGKLLSKQEIQVKYGGFKRYKLAKSIDIDTLKNFYVGYEQNFVDLLSVGYDKNNDHSDKVFFNLDGTNWTSYNTQPGYTKGSMMIRAVFNKNQQLVTPIEEKNETETPFVIFYPIPAEDILNITGEISLLKIYDITGKLLLSKSFNPFESDKSIDISALSSGIFISEINVRGTTVIKKIIIQRQ